MKITPILASILIFLSGLTYAGGSNNHNHDHEYQPQYGGVTAKPHDHGIDYELVAKPEIIALYLRDHTQPVNTQGVSVKLTLLNGTEKSEIMLAAVGDGKLEAKGNFKVTKGTKVVAFITMPDKKTNNIRFVIP